MGLRLRQLTGIENFGHNRMVGVFPMLPLYFGHFLVVCGDPQSSALAIFAVNWKLWREGR